MSEEVKVQLNEGEPTPEERATFLAAFAPVPQKPKRGKKPKVEGEKPAMSKFQTKHQAEAAAAVTQAETPAVTVEVEAPERPAVDLAAGLVADIMGEDNEDWETMLRSRTEAYALLARMRAMNMPELERKAKFDAHDVSTFETWDAQKKLYNLLRDIFQEQKLGKNRAEQDAVEQQYQVVKAKFEAAQTALKTDPESPVAKAFLARVLAHVEATGRMEKHLANQVKATEIMIAFEVKKAEHEALHKQAVALFEDANVIAIVHGWPLTEKKEANGKKE
jgi:hypothetical protein